MIQCQYCLKHKPRAQDKRYTIIICDSCLLRYKRYSKDLNQYNLTHRNKELVLSYLKKHWDMNIDLENLPSFNKYLINELGIVSYIKQYIKEREKEDG